MLTLRPHQTRTVCQTHDALRRHRSVVLVAPTGSGKRYLAVWWALGIAGKGRRLLIVTDRQILVRQMADECRAHGVDYGVVMGNEPENRSAPVQIASVATLKRRNWDNLPAADWVIYDECHKETSAYSTLHGYYLAAKHVGLTATPVGAEGRAIIPAPFEALVEPVKNSELISQGWLLPTQVITPSEPDTAGVTIANRKEYNQEQLGRRVEECTVFADVFGWYEKFADLSAIMFCPRVKYARGVAEQFKERGITAEVIEAATSNQDRKQYFERFAAGDLRVLVSVDVLKEGFDAPHAGLGIDLQPNNQLRTFWQKVGRVKRPHPGQERAVWLDFAGNFWKHLHPDEDPQWDQVTTNTSTADIVRKQKDAQTETEKEPWSCPQCSYVLAPWQRLHGGTCPNCGHEATKPIRRIRMADGSMKTISAEESVKIKRSKHSQQQSTWFGCVKIAHHSGKPLNFARYLFHKKTGEWPSDMIWCPDSYDSGDWRRLPADVYPGVR